MSDTRRHTITIVFVVLISLTLLAAPARGGDWFGLRIGGGGFGISFGSTDWAVYGSSWQEPGWTVDYHVALSGYGEWVWVSGLGQCWRPWVRADWRPYTHGRWVWTGYGWTWIAYEPWGYFPHHYGHWAMTPTGWVWAPGTVYSPARVIWVDLGPHVGWYAAPPPGWSHSQRGFHVGYSQGYRDGFVHGYGHGAADGYWTGWSDARYATYVDWHRLGSDDLGSHAVSAAAVRAATPRAVPRSGVAAPDRSQLVRRGIAVPEMTLEQRTVRVGDREVMVARPREAASSVLRHGRSTAQRTLAPAAAERLGARAPRQQDSRRAPLGQGPATARPDQERPGGREISVREPEPRGRTLSERSGSARAEASGAATASAHRLRSPVRATPRVESATEMGRRAATVQPPSSPRPLPAANRSAERPSSRHDARSPSALEPRLSRAESSSAASRTRSRTSADAVEARPRRTSSDDEPADRPDARSRRNGDREDRGRAPSQSSARRR